MGCLIVVWLVWGCLWFVAWVCLFDDCGGCCLACGWLCLCFDMWTVVVLL